MNTWKSNQFVKKFMDYALITFYVFALGVIVFLVFYWLIDKETFYFLDDKIHISTNTSYAIEVIGKSVGKTNEDFTWESSNPDIISVDEHGTVSALQQGVATITATSKLGLVTRSIRVSASDFLIYSIVFENERMVINQGEEINLQPILNGEKNIRTNLTWVSSDASIASVDENGKVTGKSAGSIYITAIDEYSEHSAKVRVDVIENVQVEVEKYENVDDEGDSYEQENHPVDVNIISISLSPKELNLHIGDEALLQAEIKPSNATNQNVTWKSSDTSVATVDANGKITAVSEGSCIIYVTSEEGEKKAFSTVVVKENVIPVSSISFAKTKYTISEGDKLALVPTIQPSNATSQKVTWKSSDTSVATIDSKGILTAKKSGTVTITATTEDGNKEASVTVTVNPQEEKVVYMEEIDLHYNKQQMELGETVTLSPTYKPENVSNSNIVFKSSIDEVISITADGVMHANKPGFSIITAVSQDGKASTSLLIVVYPKKVAADDIIFSTGTHQMKIGETYSINYSLSPSNAYGNEIIWASNNTDVATVSSSGVITGLKAGSATIAAKIVGTDIQTTMKITVVPNNTIISIEKQSLKVYQSDIALMEYQNNYSRAMQNFAIDKIGTSDETFYFSYPTISNLSTSKTLTTAEKSALMRTVVQKISKSKLTSTKASDRTYMFLNGTGHGQSFDYFDGHMFLNGDGYIAESDGLYWGYYQAMVQVKYSANKPTDTFTYQKKITFSSTDGANYSNPEIAIDQDNDMMAVRSGRKVFVYQLSEALAGNKVLLYEFTISDTVDGQNYSRQGHDISNGYYYQYRSKVGTPLYVEVYNMLGELQYTKKITTSLTKAEAEGLKIYNNRIYIGITYEKSGKSGRYNAIYYFN